MLKMMEKNNDTGELIDRTSWFARLLQTTQKEEFVHQKQQIPGLLK